MYGTISDWRTYASARGNDAPANATDELATEALVRASDYIKYRYVARFTSACSETDDLVEYATYEAAAFELDTVGFFNKTFTPGQQKVLTGVDVIKWTPVKAPEGTTAAAGATPTVTTIEAMLAQCLPPAPGSKPSAYLHAVGGDYE